jgi:fermentation-respiration switch protein FrsA (DUF1100 family)
LLPAVRLPPRAKGNRPGHHPFFSGPFFPWPDFDCLVMMKRLPLPRRLIAFTSIGLVGLGLLVAGCGGLEQKERELTFRVEKGEAGWYHGIPDGVQEFFLPVSDEAGAPKINAWWWPAADPQAPAVYYLHGARWNLTGHVRRIEQLRKFGFSVLAIDYRGFGKSDGDLPSEKMAYEDARAGWAWLTARQPDPAKRLIYGHSLGGAVAIDLAASLAGNDHPQARGLIVESSFTTLAELATELSFSWVPTSFILSQKFDSLQKIETVDLPFLVVHGSGDRFIPSRFSEALFKAARAPKKFLLVPNGSHNNSMWTDIDAYQKAIDELFALNGTAPLLQSASQREAERAH